VRAGVPFIFFTVAGSVGLGRLMQGRRDVQDAIQEEIDERAPVRAQAAKKEALRDLHAELRLVQRQVDIDSYANKPVPRPWEDQEGSSS